MGDSSRFRLFADLVARRFASTSRVADIASGKGQLQAELYRRGFDRITSWDTRGRNAGPRRNYRFSRFDHRNAPRDYDLVLGMHPDQATDHIVAYAVRRRVPFVICPCCVLPSAAPFEGVGYDGWLQHLTALAAGFDVERVEMPMHGRRIVLVGWPGGRGKENDDA